MKSFASIQLDRVIGTLPVATCLTMAPASSVVQQRHRATTSSVSFGHLTDCSSRSVAVGSLMLGCRKDTTLLHSQSTMDRVMLTAHPSSSESRNQRQSSSSTHRYQTPKSTRMDLFSSTSVGPSTPMAMISPSPSHQICFSNQSSKTRPPSIGTTITYLLASTN